MIRKTISTFFYGATIAIGALVGTEVYNKLKTPSVRAKIKIKLGKIKDVFSKEES